VIRADVELIERMYRRGVSAAKIAPVAGCTERTVQRHIVRLGLRAPDPRCTVRFTKEQRAQALSLFDEGLSQQDVAATMGVSTQTLNRHLPGHVWTRQQCGEHSVAVRRFNHQIKEVWS
jgi:transposase-like protein